MTKMNKSLALERESWSNGIPSLYTGWTFFPYICLKRRNKRKRGRRCPIKIDNGLAHLKKHVLERMKLCGTLFGKLFQKIFLNDWHRLLLDDAPNTLFAEAKFLKNLNFGDRLSSFEATKNTQISGIRWSKERNNQQKSKLKMPSKPRPCPIKKIFCVNFDFCLIWVSILSGW